MALLPKIMDVSRKYIFSGGYLEIPSCRNHEILIG